MAPYTKAFRLPDGNEITSVVLDKDEFLAFAEELRDLVVVNAPGQARAGDDQIQAIIEAQHLPMMARGTKTEKFYERWGVKTRLLSVIVRGAGVEVLERLVAQAD